MKHTRRVQVKNQLGLHTRPAIEIVKLLQTSKSHVSFTHKHETINAKSILSILMIAAQKDAEITITAEGEDAKKTIDQLVTAFEEGFGEDS